MKVKKIAEFNPTPSSPIVERSEIDYIDTAAVVEGRLGDVQRLTTMFPSRAQREIHTNDILISSVRPNLKHNYFVDDSADGMIASSGFIHVRVKNSSDVSPRFLYYYLTSPAQVQRYVKIADSSQSAYPSFNKDVVENIELPEIDLPTQLRIAGVLGSLDEKVELNRKKIAELEALAKTIYDYWFVQFDFPDKNGKPYKSSGGKMVWNEQLKREVPEGWEVSSLDTVFIVCSGKDHKQLMDGLYPVLGSGGIMRYAEKFLYDSESVLIPRKGTLNNVMFMQSPFWTVDTMFYTRPKRNNMMKYTFMAIRDFDFARLNTGTGVPSMTASIIGRIQIAIPPNELAKETDQFLGCLFSRIDSLKSEIGVLTRQRDTLLPLLMNGQVSVG